MWLLDAHNSDHAAGVPANVFRSIFYLCGQCGCYMTQRISRDHYEDVGSGDVTSCVNLRLGGDLDTRSRNAGRNRFRTVAQEFPLFGYE